MTDGNGKSPVKITGDLFRDAIVRILRINGPLSKEDLFKTFRRLYYHLNNTDSIDNFRVRLRRIKDYVQWDDNSKTYVVTDNNITKKEDKTEYKKITLLPKAVNAFHHYDVLDEDCGCPLCIDWRAWRDASNKLAEAVIEHDRNCTCVQCNAFHKARFSFLATENRRNVWTEISYHVTYSDDFIHHKTTIMTRLKNMLDDTSVTNNWWAICGAYYPLAWWFRKLTKGIPGFGPEMWTEQKRK